MIITSPDYTLPEVYAQWFNEIFTTSANKPLLITGTNKATGEKLDYVVKLRGADRMSIDASMRELIASFIAIQMGIPVVEPAIIDISPEFLETLKGNDSWLPASKSIGFNYGSLNLKGYKTLLINQLLNNNQLSQAQNAFAFDMFIQNSDRTTNKPNMLTNGNDLILLDHEIAFGFIFAPFLTYKIWEMAEANKEWIRNHCLLPLIKGKEYDFDEFSQKIDNLNEEFWAKAWSLVPNEWKSDQFSSIKDTLATISSHKEQFILELKKIMS